MSSSAISAMGALALSLGAGGAAVDAIPRTALLWGTGGTCGLSIVDDPGRGLSRCVGTLCTGLGDSTIGGTCGLPAFGGPWIFAPTAGACGRGSTT